MLSGNWLAAALVFVVAACAGPARPSTESAGDATGSSAPKHLTTAIASAPPRFVRWMSPPAIELAGAAELEALLTTGLGTADGAGGLDTGLAEQVPTIENGLWKVAPDGRMETTWKIRSNAYWHDGTPVTAADLLFTAEIRRDRELPLSPSLAYQFVQDIQALATDTVQATWKSPFIGADTLFSGPFLPKHLLEPTYRQDKTAFTDLSYWTSGLVNTGPFKLQQWTPGSGVLLVANDQYALGRPHIDEMEVKFLQDPSTLLANILSDAVEMTLGRTLSLDQALQVRDQWRGGHVDLAFSQWIVIYPEFINPNPAMIANLDFRRALVHALDRQQMVDNFMFGLTSVTDTLLYPGQRDYEQFIARAPKYPFDARRATEMMGTLGYQRSADGLLRDSANQPLALEIRTSAGDDQQEKSLFASADDWRKLGITVDTVL
ncbi:MAG TPA: ABC transporter substrate-binding protein, partial [Chloroflexota bacterium]